MPDDPKDLEDEATTNKPRPFDDEDERTSIKIDLTPPPAAAKPAAPALAPSLADEDEEESTKVLDWDRAMRKSLEKDKPPPKK